MRVLLVTHYYADHKGGIEIVADEVARRLRTCQVAIVWAASGPAPDESARHIIPLPMTSWNIIERLFGIPYPLWSVLSFFKLLQAVRRADVIHIHEGFYLGSICAAVAGRLLNKPIVVTQHVGHIPYRSRVLRLLLAGVNRTVARLVLSIASQAVFVSNVVRDYFAGFTRLCRPALVIPNGVDRTLFFPVSSEQRTEFRQQIQQDAARPLILFVGRFVEKKGLHIVQSLTMQFSHCDWVFAGWGPLDPAAWQLDNVRCLGRTERDQLPSLYCAADLLILPSVGEGFPLVVQEAMSCGTPALISSETASALPGVEDYVFHTVADKDAMQDQLEQLLADESVKLQAARNRVAEFAEQSWSWQTCADAYYSVYQSISHAAEAECDPQPSAIPTNPGC